MHTYSVEDYATKNILCSFLAWIKKVVKLDETRDLRDRNTKKLSFVEDKLIYR